MWDFVPGAPELTPLGPCALSLNTSGVVSSSCGRFHPFSLVLTRHLLTYTQRSHLVFVVDPVSGSLHMLCKCLTGFVSDFITSQWIWVVSSLTVTYGVTVNSCSFTEPIINS